MRPMRIKYGPFKLNLIPWKVNPTYYEECQGDIFYYMIKIE